MLDVWSYITEFIGTNNDKFRLMMTCTEISKCRFYFNEMIAVEKIAGSRWFNNFVDILVFDNTSILPSFTQYLTFKTDLPINNYISSTVTHLTFGSSFNQSVKNCIPSSVTHLTFGFYFNQSIENSIPSSVTHLTFDNYFRQPIEKCIPPSVTHLKLGHRFNQYSENSIPSTITHLRLCCCQSDIKYYLPASIKEISFDTALKNI